MKKCWVELLVAVIAMLAIGVIFLRTLPVPVWLSLGVLASVGVTLIVYWGGLMLCAIRAFQVAGAVEWDKSP